MNDYCNNIDTKFNNEDFLSLTEQILNGFKKFYDILNFYPCIEQRPEDFLNVQLEFYGKGLEKNKSTVFTLATLPTSFLDYCR